jgi:hypothetical protein
MHFDALPSDPVRRRALEMFETFLRCEPSEENLHFCVAVVEYKSATAQKPQEMFDHFLASDAKQPISRRAQHSDSDSTARYSVHGDAIRFAI